MTAGTAIRKEFDTREEWLQERKKGIGASEAATILGLSPWDSRLNLFARKRGLLPEVDETEAMKWGRLLEPPIAQGFAEETKRVVKHQAKPVMWTHPEHKFAFATLDALQEDGEKGEGILEIKTSGSAEGWSEGNPPEQYLVQLQHQLACTGLRWGTLAVLVRGRELYYRDVDRNDRFIEAMLRKEVDFWRMVINDIAPDPSGPTAKEALQALYPKDTGEVVELGEEFIEIADELETMKAQEKQLKAHIEDRQNRLKAAMGNATQAILANGWRYQWRLVERAGYTVQPSSSRRFQRLKG